MNLIFMGTYAVWLASEILLNRLLRSKNTDRQNTDKNSLSFIWITIGISTSASVYISIAYYLPVFSNPLYAWSGIAVIIAGILIRFISIVSLGRFFTVDVTIRQGHTLKKDGLYKYLRHPSYFASLLSFIGFGLSLNNWISLAVITTSIVVAFSIRVRVEEKVLIEAFGAEYTDYKKTTSGFIPFIY